MDSSAELEKKIEETVLEVLRNSDMDKVTEFMIRRTASEMIGINLSDAGYKKFVRKIVESYLSEQESKSVAATVEHSKEHEEEKPSSKEHEEEKPSEEEEEEEEEGEDEGHSKKRKTGNKEEEEEEEDEGHSKKRKAGNKEYDDEGGLIVCRLSKTRRLTITEFRGKTLVSMREYYRKDGKELPTSKGISLTSEQWESFSKNVPAIEKAIRKITSRLN